MLSFIQQLTRQSLTLYWTLLKIMVPVMVLVRIAVEFGLIDLMGDIFSPIMAVVGLPAATGIVFATTCLVGIYGGMAALLGLLPSLDLSTADLTILACMMLAAHNLPIELRVAQKAGVSLTLTLLLRLGFAILHGAVLNLGYQALGWLQEPGTVMIAVGASSHDWAGWAIESATSLVMIFPVIVGLLAVLRLMDRIGLTALLTRLLQPVLGLMGMSPVAGPLTMVGGLLGLTYGGGLIIAEARAGHLPPKDVVLSVWFMSVCHSLIEDTALLLAMGGHWSGVLVSRFLLAVLVMVVLARLLHRLPDSLFQRWVFRASPAPAAETAKQAA